MKIGDKITFRPCAFINYRQTSKEYFLPVIVTGRVVGIHIAHRYCRVEYYAGGTVQHECFKILKRSGGRISENNSSDKS